MARATGNRSRSEKEYLSGARKLGRILVEEGHISFEQLEKILRDQEKYPDIPLGQVAVDRGFLTKEQLSYILKKHGKELPIGEMLINARLITGDQLREALRIQGREGGRLGEVLVGEGFVTESDLYEILGWQFGFPFVPLGHLDPAKALQTYVNPTYAAQHRIVPIALLGRRLTVAVADPTDRQCLQDLVGMTHLEIDTVLATESDIAAVYGRLYGRELLKERPARQWDRHGAFTDSASDRHSSGPGPSAAARPGVELPDGQAWTESAELSWEETAEIESGGASDVSWGEGGALDLELIEEKDLEDGRSKYLHTAQDSPVVRILVQKIIARALRLRASDIHLEADVSGPRLRLRIDGVLYDHDLGKMSRIFRTNYRSVISRLKILGSMDISEKRRPQDGSFRLVTRRRGKSSPVDFRLATLPSRFGEGMVVRILDQLKAPESLESLGLTPLVMQRFRGLLERPTGIILITGPTGSGKSSTLYAALRTLYKPEIKILTAEDPIEFTHPGISQAEVNLTIGNTFARYLRGFLRQDPDVIMVGEIRDAETAEMALRAAQTGHMLLSTLHTNNSTATVKRLMDLVDDPNGIASTLVGAMAQRLVRRICRRCAEPYEPPEHIIQEWFDKPPSEITWMTGRGCEACGSSGYSGRLAVAELWIPTMEEMILINKRASGEELRASALQGMPSLGEDALLKAMMGSTTLEEALRVVPFEDVVQVKRTRALRIEELQRRRESPQEIREVVDEGGKKA